MKAVAKNLAVLIAASLLGLLLLEGGAGLIYRAYKQRPFDRGEVLGRLLAERVEGEGQDAPVAAQRGANVPDEPVIIHPYFGFVVNPERPGINRYGFFNDEPITRRSPDRAIVMIFGGSVADQVYYLGRDTLAAALAREGPFRGRRIEVLSTALGGYKQPQQLLILNYLLALGAEFDVVINLDGFNEVDGAQDNVLDGVNPFFPHNWNLHARQGFDPAAMVHVGQIELIRRQRARWRALFARPPLRQSRFGLVLWDFLDQRQEAALRAETAALNGLLAADKLPARVRGPDVSFSDSDTLYAALADVWQRSSLQMARLCRASGIRYAHFLQPNQYVPGSKVLTEEERATAYDQDVADTQRVATGYPLLIERGAELRELGVNFVDLTGLYRDEAGTIYNDPCCHVNQRGAELMAEAMAGAINGN